MVTWQFLSIIFGLVLIGSGHQLDEQPLQFLDGQVGGLLHDLQLDLLQLFLVTML